MIAGTAVQLEVFRNLAPSYKTLEEAEDDFGFGLEDFLDVQEPRTDEKR